MKHEGMRNKIRSTQLNTKNIIIWVSSVLTINPSVAMKKALLIPFILLMPSILFGWTINAGFESGTVGQLASGTDAWSSWELGSATLISSTRAHTGTKSCVMNWPAGADGYSKCTGVLDHASVSVGGEIWVRGYYYFPSGAWNWGSSSRVKGLRIQSDGSHSGKLGIMFVPESTTVAHLMFGNDDATSQLDTHYNNADVTLGTWTCIELYIRPSNTSSGIVRIWKDGILVGTITGANVTSASNVLSYTMVMSYWNAPTPTQNQSLWLDDFVVTNEQPTKVDAAGNRMIGPTNWGNSAAVDTTPPQAPANPTVVVITQ